MSDGRVRGRQVGPAVAVQVADRERAGFASGRVIVLGSKLPSPLFRSTETLCAFVLAVARSGLPSPFRSPIATA